MKFRSLMTVICVLATANIVSAAPFAYIANSGTNNVSVIDTFDNSIKATLTLPAGTQPYPYSVAVSPSGQYVYVGIQGTNKISIIDAATNTLLPQTINLGADKPGGLAINAAETRLYVASNSSNTLIVIDITNIKTGSGPIPEVGRVTVDDVTISNPEGVAILSDVNGNSVKAYVANASTGKVAVLSLDEVNNLYIRTALITIGGNPMGLALNTAGTKLYVANLSGTATVINTATDAIIASPAVGPGTLSMAVRPDDTQVYAPSNTLDKIYEINASNAVSGTQYNFSDMVPATTAPFGSAVAPNNNLYVAMYGSNKLAVFNTTTHAFVGSGIPVGTQPTSMGNFIQPAFLYTITSAAQTDCTIAPLGAIPVTKLGRVFKVTATSGQCEVFTGTTACSPTRLGGTSQGFPNTYNYVNGTANGTICAENKSGTFFTLSGDWITSVGGYLVSNPAGINATNKSALFTSPTLVILSLGDPANTMIQAGSWTGDCAYANPNGQNCTVTMDADRTYGATIVQKIIQPGGPIKNETKETYHATLAEATTAATTNDVIKVSTTYILGGSTNGTSSVTVSLSGGWDMASYLNQTKPSPTSMGALTITNVAVIADNLTI